VITRSVKTFVFPWPGWCLSDDEQFVDLAVAELVVVGVAVASPEILIDVSKT